MKEAHDHKRVSPQGRALGAQLVRITEPAINALAAQGEPDERCRSCAFRAGTVPNGCAQTQADAIKAVIENVPFMCHQADRLHQCCHGWFAARWAIRQAEKVKGPMPFVTCPWEFSKPDSVEGPAP